MMRFKNYILSPRICKNDSNKYYENINKIRLVFVIIIRKKIAAWQEIYDTGNFYMKMLIIMQMTTKNLY